jgi:hypothetical protein
MEFPTSRLFNLKIKMKMQKIRQFYPKDGVDGVDKHCYRFKVFIVCVRVFYVNFFLKSDVFNTKLSLAQEAKGFAR